MSTTGAPAPETHIVPAIPRFADEDYALIGLPSENSLKALKNFCKNLVGTPFLPKSLVKDQDSDQQAVTLLAVCLTGREMGFSPMQSLRAFWLSPDGRLGMYADAMFALMLRNGALIKWEKLDNEGAILAVTRGQNSYRSEFSTEDAARAGLASKDIWKKYPRAMCRSRVGGDTFRTLFADLGGSQVYTKEELQDMDDVAEPFNREAEADRKAEADPGLKLEPKALDAAPAANIIEIPTKTSTRQPEPVLTHAEAKTEAFLKRQDAPPARAERKPAAAREPVTQEARKPSPVPPTPANLGDLSDANAAKLGLTEEDIPRANAPEPVDPKQAMAVRIKAFCAKFGGAPLTVTRFSKAFFGNPEDMSDMAKLGEALNLLENALLLRTDAIPIYLENPEQMGQNLRIMANDIAKEEALAKAAEPVARSKRQPKSTPPPPPPPPPVEPADAQNPLDDILPQAWSGETCDLAWSIMKKLRMPQDKLMTSLKSFGILKYSDNDAAAFFQMYYHSPDSTLLMKRATERGLAASRVLDEFVEGMFLHAPLTHQTNPNAAIQAIMNAMTEIQSLETVGPK